VMDHGRADLVPDPGTGYGHRPGRLRGGRASLAGPRGTRYSGAIVKRPLRLTLSSGADIFPCDGRNQIEVADEPHSVVPSLAL
jgi:hypothetical protein